MKQSSVVALVALLLASCASPASAQADPRLNPAVTPETLAATICHKGYSRSIRPPVEVTRRIKAEMAAAQHVPVASVVLDHIIPLEGGGAPGGLTDRANLQLEPTAEAAEKDRVEDRMHTDVCTGRVGLREAQAAMTDWRRYK